MSSRRSERGDRPVKRPRGAAPLSLLRESNRSSAQTTEMATSIKEDMHRKKRRIEESSGRRDRGNENENENEEGETSWPVSTSRRGAVRSARIASSGEGDEESGEIEGVDDDSDNNDGDDVAEAEDEEAAEAEPGSQSARSTQVQRSTVRASDG